MEQKTFEFKLTAADPEGRTIEGYAAVFGNRELGGDLIHSGAFTKTITERGPKIRFLWQHNPGEPIGAIKELREDPMGLYIKAVISDTARGRDALALLRDGAINAMSIGYDPIGQDYSKDTSGDTTRNLREIKLWECSLVTFPMNEQAGVTALKMVQPYGNLPLADRGREWDADAAMGRVREWAGATESPNARYARAFMWHDAAAADQFGSYKLGFADVIDGELTAIPRGLFAVAAVLQGARGGVDIPQADQERVQGIVARYYEKMRREFDDESLVVPWQKSIKAGRVISKASLTRIMQAIDAIQSAADALEDLLAAAGIETEEPPAEEMAGKDARRDEAGPPPLAPTSARDKLLLAINLEAQR